MKEYSNIKQSAIRKSRTSNLILRKYSGKLPDDVIPGVVIAIIGRNVVVEINENDIINSKYAVNNAINSKIHSAANRCNQQFRQKKIDCIYSGTIITKNKYSNILTVGDNVYIKYIPDSLSKIISIIDRTTKLSRKDNSNNNREQIIAANICTLIIFVSILEPEINLRLIDRFIVSALISKIEPIIFVNKIDLLSLQQVVALMKPYRALKIKVFYGSILENKGVEKFLQFLKNKNSVLLGVSGSGKSSLLNCIFREQIQKIRDINQRTQKGVHTTSFSHLFRFPKGGSIIDTPGIREFGIWDLHKEELGVIFPDFRNYYLNCKYTSCNHICEPGCAVLTAVEQGKIKEDRYISYLNIYSTLEN